MQENIFRSAIKSGLILGALFTLRFVLSIVGSGWIMSLSRFAVMVIIIVAMWKLLERFRDNENEGFISYGKSLGFTMLSFLYASIISVVVRIVYYISNPDVLGDAVNEALLALDQMGMPITEGTERMLEVTLSPAFLTFLTLLGNMIGGLIIGSIISAIVKKEKGVFEE